MDLLIGIFSLFLILFLWVMSYTIPEKIYVKSISKELINQRVYLKGNVTKLYLSNRFSLYKLNDGTGEIKLVFFKKVHLHNPVKIVGVVNEYKNELEVIGIRCLD